MADDSIKSIDDILTQAEIGKLDAHWRGDIKRQFKTIGERGWLDHEPPARRILLEIVEEKNALGDYTQEPQDFLAQGIVAMLAATGGVGKTQALIQLALAIASGTKWLDTFHVIEPGHVVILLAEEDEDEAWRRFYYSARHLGLDKTHPEAVRERIWVIPMAGLPARLIDATTGESSRTFEGLQSALAQHDVDWRLVILDPASRLMPEDGEVDSAAATDFVAHLEALTQTSKGKPTILFSHHTRKGGTGKAGVRGSSALTDGARWVTTMRPYGVQQDGTIDEDGEGRVLLKLHKSNYGKPGFSCRFAFDARGYLRALTPTELDQEKPATPTSQKINRKNYNNG
jgi:RecA-family ATPase